MSVILAAIMLSTTSRYLTLNFSSLIVCFKYKKRKRMFKGSSGTTWSSDINRHVYVQKHFFNRKSPKGTPLLRVHKRLRCTVEVFGECIRVWHGTDNSVFCGCVNSRRNVVFWCYTIILGAPDASSTDPKQLLRRVVKTRKLHLTRVFFFPIRIGWMGLLDCRIINDVLFSRFVPIQLRTICWLSNWQYKDINIRDIGTFHILTLTSEESSL